MEKFIPYEKLSKKEKRKIDQARRQTWGDLNPVTRSPENSKAYNRNKARDWKREYHEPISGVLLSMISQRGTSYPSVSNCPKSICNHRRFFGVLYPDAEYSRNDCSRNGGHIFCVEDRIK